MQDYVVVDIGGSVGLYPPTCWLTISDRRTGGITITTTYDTTTPTGRLQKVLADIRAAALTLKTFDVYEALQDALETVAYWDIEECLDVDDLVKQLENEAECYLEMAATIRAEEALAIQQRRIDAGL